jgi:hypothetical protein
VRFARAGVCAQHLVSFPHMHTHQQKPSALHKRLHHLPRLLSTRRLQCLAPLYRIARTKHLSSAKLV